MNTVSDPSTCITRLQQAMNDHDLDAMTDCFHPDYQSTFPAHPERAFQGHESMRANWSGIFAGVPDLHTTLLRSAVDGDTVWSEWGWQGHRRDGEHFAMAGVTVQGVRDGRIAWARLYMEPVQQDDETARQAVEQGVR
jgi:ketosteroid isomerase-like protein